MSRTLVPAGTRFGRGRVVIPDVRHTEPQFQGRHMVRLLCDCGTFYEVEAGILRRGGRKSCGCMRPNARRSRAADPIPRAIVITGAVGRPWVLDCVAGEKPASDMLRPLPASPPDTAELTALLGAAMATGLAKAQSGDRLAPVAMAMRRIRKICKALESPGEKLSDWLDLVLTAWEHGDWELLGYRTWTDYVNAEYVPRRQLTPVASRDREIAELRAGLRQLRRDIGQLLEDTEDD